MVALSSQKALPCVSICKTPFLLKFIHPQTPKDLAREDEWCSFVYGELDETCLYVMRRHYDLTDIYGAAPNVVKSCREYLERQFRVIEPYLEKKTYFRSRIWFG